MSNISYIRILQAIESFASAHLQIKKFASDFPTQMPNFATEDEAYPILFVSPNTSIFDENTNTFQLEVYCFDIIQKDRNNINTILSDTNQILNDLDKWLKEGDIAGIDVMTSTTATPINNALLDYAAGWQMTIVLTTDTYGICEIPFSEVPVITTEVNNIVYQTFLTCENLPLCDTFTNAIDSLQEQIDSITGNTDFVCAALSGCTVIQDINSELSGLTSNINALSATTEQIQEDYVPYTGATRDVILGDNLIDSNVGYYIDYSSLTNKQGSLAINNDYVNLYINTDSTSNGTNQFEVNPSTGLYYTKTYNDITSTLGFADNFFDVQFYSNSANTTTNQFYVNDTETFSKNGYTSIFGDNDNSFKANTYFDGVTRIFEFLTGKGDYNYTNQYGSLYVSAEEGLYLSMYSDEISSTIQSNPNQVFINVYEYTTDNTNYLYLNLEETFTTKKIVTEEGFVGNYVQFNTAATETSAVGKLKWNSTDGTLDLGLKGGNVTLQLGQEQVARVVNKTSPLIDLLEANYQVVKIVGATGQRLSVALAQADSDLDSATTLGVVTETINRNQEGFVTTGGQVKEINTTGSLQGETWNDGDVLYLSPTTAGRLTKVKPVAPQHMVIVGYVEYAHSQHGKIFVKVDNGYELDELHNVKISAATSGDTLVYNGTTQVWENKDSEYIKRQTQRVVETDFMVPSTSAAVQFPYVLTLINSGAVNSSILRNGINPGILRFRSSSSANSGVYLLPLGNALTSGTNYISPNTQIDYIFRTPATIIGTGINLRFGLGQSASSTTDIDNGYYIEMIENTLYGKTADGSTRSQTTTSFTTAINTWYHGRVKYISTSLVEYSLYSMDGTLLWSSTLTTNITTNPLNPLIIAISTNASAIDLVINDYFSATYPVSNRGALN
jgi:hypothetical protein